MLSSPISGKVIRSLLFAKKPATTMPNRLPSRNIAVVLLFRVFLWWCTTVIFSTPSGGSGPSGAGLSSGEVADSEGVSLVIARRRRRAEAIVSAESLPRLGAQAEQASRKDHESNPTQV